LIDLVRGIRDWSGYRLLLNPGQAGREAGCQPNKANYEDRKFPVHHFTPYEYNSGLVAGWVKTTVIVDGSKK
jgi:hypothetical protein